MILIYIFQNVQTNKKYKSSFQDLWLQNETFETLLQKKSLVIPTKLGAKFVLRIYQLDYMVLQPLFLMQMVLRIRKGYQRILQFHSINILNLHQVS